MKLPAENSAAGLVTSTTAISMKGSTLLLWMASPIVIVGLSVPPTGAASLFYDEALFGDLPTFVSEAPRLPLDLGNNLLTGSITFSALDSVPSDRDSFKFSVPDGMLLDQVLVDLTLLPGGSGIFSETRYQLQAADGLPLLSSTVPIAASGPLFDPVLPLAAGEYGLQQDALIGSLQSGEAQTASYTLTLNLLAETTPPPSASDPEVIASVPEPGLIAGFGLLLGLAFKVWRRPLFT